METKILFEPSNLTFGSNLTLARQISEINTLDQDTKYNYSLRAWFEISPT